MLMHVCERDKIRSWSSRHHHMTLGDRTRLERVRELLRVRDQYNPSIDPFLQPSSPPATAAHLANPCAQVAVYKFPTYDIRS